MMVINLKNKKITSITSKITSFDPILCSGTGTILYGTSFEIKENKCFCIENIYYNKGHNLCKYNQYEKLKHINELMHSLKQKEFTNVLVVEKEETVLILSWKLSITIILRH